MVTAARDRDRMLEDPFGEEPWKVALEPGCPRAKSQSDKHSRFIPVNG